MVDRLIDGGEALLMEKHGECFITEHGDICISMNEPGNPDEADDLDKDRIFPPNE